MTPVVKKGALIETMEVFGRGGVFAARQVAQAVGKDPGVVTGMLDTLVHLGKLELVDGPGCDYCPLGNVCDISDASMRCYRLVR